MEADAVGLVSYWMCVKVQENACIATAGPAFFEK